MKWTDALEKDQKEFMEIFTFDEYMEDVLAKAPAKEVRTTNLYLRDMFDYYGKDENDGFNFFSTEDHETPAVYGQVKTQNEIYQNISNFTEEGYNNKFILLVGPNGSAKSSLVKKIMRATEQYSESDEGALYSFSWVFPIDKHVKGSLGLGGASSSSNREIKSFAHLEDKDISAIINSELKDHPLLLLPLATRQQIIEDVLKDLPDQLDSIKKSYLYNGDISKKNRLIYDALLKSYKGDYLEVYKHIRVERLHINKRYSQCAVTIEPQLHVDAKAQQITMDRRLANLPPSLQSINLFNMEGEVVLANRGILEFSDLLKRPLDAFKYLLMTMETRNVNVHGILTELDILFVGTSNEVHLAAFKQHPDFNSFKGRFKFLKVPYLLNFKLERKIYQDQIDNIKNTTVFEPNSIEALCLWAVMTRLRAPQSKHYSKERLGKLVSTLNPMEKAIFYAEKTLPDKFDTDSKKLIKRHHVDLLNEFEHDALYEGKFGISPREMKQIIYEIGSEHSNVTYLEVFEYLKKFIMKKNEHDFLNMASQGDFHNPRKFLELAEGWFLDRFDSEVRASLGMVDERSYEDYIGRYIMHVNALIKNEKIKNEITGKFEPADMYIIKEFESNIALKEDPKNFRSHMISTLGAYALDNPGSKIVYTEVFSDAVKLLKESFIKEQKKIIDKVAKNLDFYLSEKGDGKKSSTTLTEENRELIKKVLENLKSKFNYSEIGTINLLKDLLKKRY